VTRSRPSKSPRQVRLETLAREAWPHRSVEVVAPDEGVVHIWDDQGRPLLHVEHALADEALCVLARRLGCMSIGAAIDATEYMLRQRASEDGVEIVCLRSDPRVRLLTEGGAVVATGASLRDAIANMDRREPYVRAVDELAIPADRFLPSGGPKP
jgi:hypothetical protein